MAGTAKPRKKFRVAVSGNTVDGREIQPQHLRDAAANYNPEVYGARVNIEHYLYVPDSDFGAMGDVVALSTEDITEGAWRAHRALCRDRTIRAHGADDRQRAKSLFQY
jgi:N-acyl-D-aspartate/D-glutamate deacylase